ncbi:response regulator [Amycolatopsis sp. cg5]|uniref:response regulator n=1 Tax=Amycolatopsis sp. cg5 TaxID=3238802 RepID=UPI0035235EA5
MISVLICDDAPIVRMGLRMIVDSAPDLTVVGEAATGAEAVSAAAALAPDVVLLDIQMPELDGIEAAQRISSRVLVLTTFDTDEHVYEALRAGASGFLVKDTSPEKVLEAIRVVAAGDALLSPSVTRRLLDTVSSSLPRADSLGLSTMDGRLLGLVARGLGNGEIGEELGLSLATVKTYVSRLLVKIGARDRAHAVALAYEHGVVRPGS